MEAVSPIITELENSEKRFMETSVTKLNMLMMQGVKEKVDPKNIFGINNTVYRSEEEKQRDMVHIKL